MYISGLVCLATSNNAGVIAGIWLTSINFKLGYSLNNFSSKYSVKAKQPVSSRCSQLGAAAKSF